MCVFQIRKGLRDVCFANPTVLYRFQLMQKHTRLPCFTQAAACARVFPGSILRDRFSL